MGASGSSRLLVGEIFRRNAGVVGGEVAASLGDRLLTHAELNDLANRTAAALRARGIGRGDRLVSWADTCLEVVPLFAALAKLGAVFAPLNARLGVDEAALVAGLARPSALVADAAHAEAAAVVAARLDVPLFHLERGGGDFDLSASALPPSPGEIHEPALRESDPHVVFFTSGSTGRPKGVVLSHRVNWLRAFQGVFRDEPERSVCMFPLFHMAAFTLALAAWQTRGEIAFVQSPTAEALLDAVERRQANRLYCIPLVWARILDADTSRWDTSSLRELDTGTSATPIELIRALKERFPGTATRIYYGSTECGSAATLPDADVLDRPGSVGLASPGADLELAENGEIRVRSPFLMDGYFDDAKATAEVLAEGWFRTGDLGTLDADGYLSIVGRLKEVIRTGGESVSPSEVEAALADCPGLAELAVVGVPDPEWGEVVCAVVVPEAGVAVDLEHVRQHCAGRIAGFKKPRRIEVVDALPRTPATGQVQRSLLVERLLTRPGVGR